MVERAVKVRGVALVLAHDEAGSLRGVPAETARRRPHGTTVAVSDGPTDGNGPAGPGRRSR